MRVTVAIAACLPITSLASADPRTDFEQARSRWQAAGATEYSFTYQDQDQDLIAPHCAGALIRVRVVPGKAVRPVVVRGIRHCPKGTSGKLIDIEVPKSIDALFDRMYRWFYNPPTKVELEATYDPKYGIPLRWRAAKPEITDSDEGFAISDFQTNK